jgi:hypothetical protein
MLSQFLVGHVGHAAVAPSNSMPTIVHLPLVSTRACLKHGVAPYSTVQMAKINLHHFQHEEIPIHETIDAQRGSRIRVIVLVQRAVGGKIVGQ